MTHPFLVFAKKKPIASGLVPGIEGTVEIEPSVEHKFQSIGDLEHFVIAHCWKKSYRFRGEVPVKCIERALVHLAPMMAWTNSRKISGLVHPETWAQKQDFFKEASIEIIGPADTEWALVGRVQAVNVHTASNVPKNCMLVVSGGMFEGWNAIVPNRHVYTLHYEPDDFESFDKFCVIVDL